jgi:hypothetical protein
MALAAEALDVVLDDADAVTVYIASEHYRHPTVAALSEHYARAKWLTGGASLVLPPTGDAVTLIPESLAPPVPWPEAVIGAWTSRVYPGPAGTPALWVHRQSASDLARARDAVLHEDVEAPVDFAHVVLVHDARPAALCRAGEPCATLVLWEPMAAYSAFQPVVRLLHPETGEWARAMAFHYPPEMWTPGDLVIDQLVVDVPDATPPTGGYRLGVSFYDPSTGETLPKLQDELFAGLEAQFPATEAGFTVDAALTPPTAERAQAACPTISRDRSASLDALRLLGWMVAPVDDLLPGSSLSVALCWQAAEAAPAFGAVTLYVIGPADAVLYSGEPADGYGFERWRTGEVIEDRYWLRLPRTLPSGDYTLWVDVGDTEATPLQSLSVAPLTRSFTAPEMASSAQIDFTGEAGEGIRLLGFDLEPLAAGQPWRATLAWEALAEMDEDYVVFLHLREAATDAPVAQADRMPLQGRYPTSLWVRGEIVVDSYVLTPPANLAPGDYALYVGFYTPDGERLLADGAYRARLAEVLVTP